MRFTSVLILLIGSCAILWYYICLIFLGFVAPKPDPTTDEAFRQFMATSVSTLSGTLATYVGMILGVQTAAREPSVNRIAAVLQTRATPISGLQAIAAIAYVVSLFIALFAWWRNPSAPDPTIVALGKSLLGLIGGALTVILNVNVRDPQD
jgi:hypothetical protein